MELMRQNYIFQVPGFSNKIFIFVVYYDFVPMNNFVSSLNWTGKKGMFFLTVIP